MGFSLDQAGGGEGKNIVIKVSCCLLSFLFSLLFLNLSHGNGLAPRIQILDLLPAGNVIVSKLHVLDLNFVTS